MKSEIGSFMEAAKGLARNPLGIIALFIALIYGFATLLLGASADKLTTDERQPLVWFIVLFPVLVLGLFYKLVTSHHGKLYAPADYKDDISFLKTLSPELKARRIEEEVESIAQADGLESNTVCKTPTENQKVNRPDKSALKTEPDNRDKIREDYITAEKLALLKFSKEEKISINEQVMFGDNRATAFDGASFNEENQKLNLIEVKFVRRPFFPASFIREIIYRAILVSEQFKRKNFNPTIRLVLIFVSTLDIEQNNMAMRLIERATKDAPINIEIKFYDFETLKKESEE